MRHFYTCVDPDDHTDMQGMFRTKEKAWAARDEQHSLVIHFHFGDTPPNHAWVESPKAWYLVIEMPVEAPKP